MNATQPSTFFQKVGQFNIAGGHSVEGQTNFDAKVIGFYTGMQCEELAEKLTAIFANYSSASEIGQIINMLDGLGHRLKNNEFESEIAEADRIELLDADIDLQVVSEGSILGQGANGDGAREAVADANLAKLVDGKVVRHVASGKILKPVGWQPADLTEFLGE